jgi:hypothetical protein
MKMIPKMLAIGCMAVTGLAQAFTLTEDFEGAFPAWESGWFGAHTDALNVYCPARGCTERGNNPDGLWLAGTGSSSQILVSFTGGFGDGVTSLSMDVAGFSPTTLSVWDKDGALIFAEEVTLTFGAFTDPGTYSNYTIASTNGIGAFGFSGIAAGNTSIDNITVGVVPEPGTYALMALGLASVVSLARRRRT